MAIGKSIVDVLKSITGKNVETIADGLEEALSGGGSGGGVLVVNGVRNIEAETITLDKTWQEIHDADFAVISIEFPDIETDEIAVQKFIALTVTYDPDNGYIVNAFGESTMTYSADSSSGYPVYFVDSGGGGGDDSQT